NLGRDGPHTSRAHPEDQGRVSGQPWNGDKSRARWARMGTIRVVGCVLVEGISLLGSLQSEVLATSAAPATSAPSRDANAQVVGEQTSGGAVNLHIDLLAGHQCDGQVVAAGGGLAGSKHCLRSIEYSQGQSAAPLGWRNRNSVSALGTGGDG